MASQLAEMRNAKSYLMLFPNFPSPGFKALPTSGFITTHLNHAKLSREQVSTNTDPRFAAWFLKFLG